MAMFNIGAQDWLDQVREEIVDPDLKIIDPHHHMWRHENGNYLARELHNDTNSGHKVEKTVYIQCGQEYRKDGPEHLKPLGEIEFVVEQAKEALWLGGPAIAGIVGRVDLQFGESLEDLIRSVCRNQRRIVQGCPANCSPGRVSGFSQYRLHVTGKDCTRTAAFEMELKYWGSVDTPMMPGIIIPRIRILPPLRKQSRILFSCWIISGRPWE